MGVLSQFAEEVKGLASRYTGSRSGRQDTPPSFLILKAALFPKDSTVSFRMFLCRNSPLGTASR